MKHKGKEHLPITITTKNAVENIKMAVESKGGDLYYEIRDLDLNLDITYFVIEISLDVKKSSNNNEQAESDTQKGNFEAVTEFI